MFRFFSLATTMKAKGHWSMQANRQGNLRCRKGDRRNQREPNPGAGGNTPMHHPYPRGLLPTNVLKTISGPECNPQYLKTIFIDGVLEEEQELQWQLASVTGSHFKYVILLQFCPLP